MLNKKFSLFSFITLIIFFCLAFPTLSNATANNDNIKIINDFLSKEDTIRIMTDNGPSYGNQAATYNLIKRLQEKDMGFKGTFELIYTERNADTFITLFGFPKNIFKDHPDFYLDEKSHIKFISAKYFISQKNRGNVKQVHIGITGAFDPPFNLSDFLMRFETIDGEHGNFNTILKVDVFILLQPYTFSRMDNSGYNTRIYKNDQETMQADSAQAFIIAPIATLSDAEEYIKTHSTNAALQPMIDAIKKNEINFLPIYGRPFNEIATDEDYPSSILEVIAGARYAQLHGSENLHKPLIIALFDTLTDEKKTEIIHLINGKNWEPYDPYPGSTEAKNAIKALNLTNDFSITNLDTSKEQIEQLENLGRLAKSGIIQQDKAEKILLISLGHLDKTVFDGLFTYSSSNVLAPIREGASSLTSLILTGKPHLRCATTANTGPQRGPAWEIGFDDLQSNDPKQKELKDRLENFYSVICAGMDKWQNNNLPQLMGQFFIDANDEHSSLTDYFMRLKNRALAPENDRIANALIAAIDALKKS